MYRKFLTDTRYHIVWQQDKDVLQHEANMKANLILDNVFKTIGDNRICKILLTLPAILKC